MRPLILLALIVADCCASAAPGQIIILPAPQRAPKQRCHCPRGYRCICHRGQGCHGQKCRCGPGCRCRRKRPAPRIIIPLGGGQPAPRGGC